MVASIDDIADALRRVAGDATKTFSTLAPYFADPVDVRHEPAGPSDGPVPKELLVAAAIAESEAIARALPDADRQPEIDVDGDAIRVRGRTDGVLADGTEVHLDTTTIFFVADGAIVGLRAVIDPEMGATMGKVLGAGGFELPADLMAKLAQRSQ